MNTCKVGKRSCNDGLRPVIMKLKSTDEAKMITYLFVKPGLQTEKSEAAQRGLVKILNTGR